MLNRMKNVLLDSLKRKDKLQFETLTKELYPIDVAEVLTKCSEKELKTFVSFSTPEFQAKVLEQASDRLQLRLIRVLNYSEIVHLFTHMSRDDVADALGHLPINLRKDLLNEMKDSDLTTLEELLGYSRDSAGGIMTTEYIALSHKLSIKEALDKIREIGPKTEVIETIFVLNQKDSVVPVIIVAEVDNLK